MEKSFPPYAYVPGHWPHPMRDPEGHRHGQPEMTAEPLPSDPTAWRDHGVFVRALELFDHGYYWEAHEGLEALWIAAGREGPTADVLSGLIKLAAAAIKLRQGKASSALELARRATERLDRAEGAFGSAALVSPYLEHLRDLARQVPNIDPSALRPDEAVELVYETRIGSSSLPRS